MAQALVKNNAYSTLAAGISAIATSITVAVGHGSRFPTVSGGNFFYATLVDAANVIEVVKVVARAGDVLTVTRGQDGTAAAAYLLGDRIELRPTAALFDDKLSKGGGVLTGPLSVPAGAATTEVPQIQEVVKRAGDTMTGPLTLPELRGITGILNLQAGDRLLSPDVGGLFAPGMVIQVQRTQLGTILNTAVDIPWDNTIPQNTEGAQAFAITFTPKFIGSLLKVDVVLNMSATSTGTSIGALFRDVIANALAAGAAVLTAGQGSQVSFSYFMVTSSLTAIDFKARFGGASTGTVTLNGYNSLQKLGGVMASSMTITEIAQ